ncbi:MAG TPA: hypothetical protein GX707_13850 [Epulopiscium sp.]|nr:hypothetical protein [Candidatus Epulonipiscium sp.]
MNELKHKIKSKDFKGVLSRKTKLPRIDVIREVLKGINLSGLENVTSSIIKSCSECSRTTLKNGKVDAAHNGVFMSLVGSHPRLIIDFELYKGSSDSSKKTEGELTVAKRLLEKEHQKYNKMVDIVEEEWGDSKRGCM